MYGAIALIFGSIFGAGLLLSERVNATGNLYQHENRQSSYDYYAFPFVPYHLTAPSTSSTCRKKQKRKFQTDLACSICLETFVNGTTVTELSCGHFFHEYCICKWFNIESKSCPNCRGMSEIHRVFQSDTQSDTQNT